MIQKSMKKEYCTKCDLSSSKMWTVTAWGTIVSGKMRNLDERVEVEFDVCNSCLMNEIEDEGIQR